MRIYENDKGEKFVEDRLAVGGECPQGRFYWHPDMNRIVREGSERWSWDTGGCMLLRPATPEEVAESLGFYDSSKKLPLTLPLVEGQIVICRDGVERTVIAIDGPLAFCDHPGCVATAWYARNGHWNHFERRPEDAISDSPRWKPEKKDEKLHTCGGCKQYTPVDGPCPVCAKEKQARAAEKDTGCRTEALPVTSTGCTQLADSQEPKPAAPPAILPEWTDGDVRAYMVQHSISAPFGFERQRVSAHMMRDTKPVDTRPDIVQRDASSDSFVWRRDWRVGR